MKNLNNANDSAPAPVDPDHYDFYEIDGADLDRRWVPDVENTESGDG